MSMEVKVSLIPKCDVCWYDDNKSTPSSYDANLGHTWAYVCEHHFKSFGCKLGTGLGQRLILDPTLPRL